MPVQRWFTSKEIAARIGKGRKLEVTLPPGSKFVGMDIQHSLGSEPIKFDAVVVRETPEAKD